MGAALSGVGHADCLLRPPVTPIHRRGLADARRLGPSSPFLGKSDLAFHADVVLWLHDFRCGDCDLVSSGSAIAHAGNGSERISWRGTFDAVGLDRLTSLVFRRLRFVLWIDITGVGRAESRNLNKNRITPGLCKMVHSCRFRIDAPRRKWF